MAGRGVISSWIDNSSWFGVGDGMHLKREAPVGVSNTLQPLIVLVTPADERMMGAQMKHTIASTSFLAKFAHAEVSKGKRRTLR